MIRLGIDTGGTYTDAAVVDVDSAKVLAKAKALTTKEDLTIGIGEAIDALPREVVQLAEQAALSTTLATNACVEGKGARSRLVIVGTTDEVLHRVDAQGKFGIPYDDVLAVEYVGSYDGTEVTIPDWDALYEANRGFFDGAESFGIASIYALNNGAVVEKSGAAFLRGQLGKFVVEATTVAAEPNVIGRGATALLNARLVPVIDEFLNAIDAAFEERGLDMPVSVVRSDGSLMSEELARLRPVETILSGPAASVTGAQLLAGSSEGLVVDIGGTTSDMAVVHGGRPNRSDGIVIGGWKTQVAGVAIDTIALGGDIAVRVAKNGRLELGTRRVMPLCVAAARWPEISAMLKRYCAWPGLDYHARYELYFLLRDPDDLSRFKEPERRFIELLRAGPLPLFDERSSIVGLKPEKLEDQGIVMRCGMTPTDAMHVRGDFRAFDAGASRLGARCLLKTYRPGADAEEDISTLADEVYDLARHRLFRQAVGVMLQDALWPNGTTELDGQMGMVADRAWERRHADAEEAFSAGVRCNAALVGVGAPTHVLLDEVARALGALCTVPEHAEVANAVGAASSRIVVEQQVHVSPLRKPDGATRGFQVRGTDEARAFEDEEEALAFARDLARRQVLAEARLRGAIGEPECAIDESRQLYGSMGMMKIVREWTITARMG